ncbi:MAG TPA: hypothetical protein VFT99_10470, partial [Roseiflexaceae bacterium]|nr:hypothetical protein [Roseiflexaceae bacterium]
MRPSRATLPSLAGVLPDQQVLLKPAEMVTYEVDAGLDRGRPDGVVFPRTAADVLALVRWAARHDIAL